MNIESQLDKNNKQILSELRKYYQVKFEPRYKDYCSVYSQNENFTIYYNPSTFDNDSIAHELLHIQLKRYNSFSIGNHIYLFCKEHKKLAQVFNKQLCDYIENVFYHYKMYPKYIEMGYRPERFVINGLNEKCTLIEIKSLKLSFLGCYKAISINNYIGCLTSIYADHVENNYSQHLKLLKDKNSKLFEIISLFWNKWKSIDIEKNTPEDDPCFDLVDSFIIDMEEWIKNKRIA